MLNPLTGHNVYIRQTLSPIRRPSRIYTLKNRRQKIDVKKHLRNLFYHKIKDAIATMPQNVIDGKGVRPLEPAFNPTHLTLERKHLAVYGLKRYPFMCPHNIRNCAPQPFVLGLG